MELWIPSQTLDVYNIQLLPFEPQISQKILVAPLKYIDNNVTLDTLVILTPTLEVIHHDLQTGKLILSLVDNSQFAIKLQMLQSYLASTLYLHQQTFFGFINPTLTAEIFKKMIFPLVYNKKLTIYMGASSRSVRVHEKVGACAGPGAGTQAPPQHQGMTRQLNAGEKIRVALQLQGISILTTPSLVQVDASGTNTVSYTHLTLPTKRIV